RSIRALEGGSESKLCIREESKKSSSFLPEQHTEDATFITQQPLFATRLDSNELPAVASDWLVLEIITQWTGKTILY
ncbi:Hypothetical predicted protein, partial [Paramuricea clavata]